MSLTTDSSMLKLLRFLAATTVLALIAILAYSLLPERRMHLVPAKSTDYFLFFDQQSGGKTVGSWIDEEAFKYKCVSEPDGIQYSYCGLQVNLGTQKRGLDLSHYTTLLAKIDYTGTNKKLRLTLHGYKPAFSIPGNFDTLKSMIVEVTPEELSNQVTIHLHEWRTAEYWIDRYKIPRELSYPEFDNVVNITVDIVSPIIPGEHEFRVHNLELRGPLFAADQWYLGVAVSWLVINLLYLVFHLVRLNRRVKLDSSRLTTLATYSSTLKDESEKYKELSHIDNLTGVLNRNGLADYMSSHYPDGRLQSRLSMMVLDLDHFKRINDKKGHDAGDAVLAEVAKHIKQNIRANDKLIRWGGEEFVLLCPDTNENEALLVAEKLRSNVENLAINHNNELIPVTVSVGVGTAAPSENFDTLFHRVDQALYQAKTLGRNCVVVAQIS